MVDSEETNGFCKAIFLAIQTSEIKKTSKIKNLTGKKLGIPHQMWQAMYQSNMLVTSLLWWAMETGQIVLLCNF